MPDKLIVLVDMDGPLAAFETKFFEVCRQNGWLLDIAGIHEQTARYATDHIIDPVQERAARDLINGSPWFRDLPVVDGAIEGLNDLASRYDVWICTKPLEKNHSVRDDKAAWVREHLGGNWEYRLIITPDKSMVRGHVLLDDAVKLEWLDNSPSWTPVIFPYGYNQQPGCGWEDFPTWSWGDDPALLEEFAMARRGSRDTLIP